MNTNVITAVFGALRETKVRPRYRYNRGQVLVLKGIRDLPDYYEVHFANIGGEVDATPEIGTAEGVIIPDSFFESAAGILAYIYVHDEATDGTTIYKVTIPIIDRPRPADTEPTQEEADIISQAIVALNENVGRAEESAETAQSAADGAAQAERNAGVSAERAEAAEQTLRSMGISVPVWGMVKDDRHRTRALINSSGEEISISSNQALFSLIGNIQEETHRFSIEYQRSLRMENYTSQLDKIPGVGEKRRNQLLRYFKTLKAVKEASLEELSEAVPANTAKAVYDFYHSKEEGSP